MFVQTFCDSGVEPWPMDFDVAAADPRGSRLNTGGDGGAGGRIEKILCFAFQKF